jgi:hypothetical protein
VVHPTAVTGLVQKKVMAAANIKTPIIPEADYYLTGVNYHLMYGLFGTPLITYPIAVQGETQAAEGSGAGWEDVYSSFVASDAEVGTYISWGRGRDIFKRWPGDVADGHDWNLETARDYRFDIGASGVAHWTCIMWVTYHSMTFPKTIAVTGSGGGTVTINVRRATYEAGTLVWTGTRVGDGNVTATLMDDIDTKFTEARESDTLVGRSGNWT